MAMDFMAHPAQLLSEITLVSLLLLILFSCSLRAFLPNEQVIPNEHYLIDNQGFVSKNGVVFRQEKPFSGWQYALSNQGDTLALIPFWQGKIQGCKKTWYSNGHLANIRFYESGKQVGTHQGWWEKGQRKFEYQFANDVYHGVCHEWHENGQRSQTRHYQNGQEAGQQSVWRADGSLQANYVAKNGRNYGIIGVKHCVNKAP